MKKVVIVHGYTGNPHKNWFPWLKSELEKSGVEVVVPQMPHAEAPQPLEWLSYLQSVIGEPTEDTYLIGHSLGCITILRYLEGLNAGIQVGGAVLVAGFAEPIHFTELNPFFKGGLRVNKVKDSVKEIVLIHSDNDEHVPLWQGEHLSEKLGAKLIVLQGAGHINEKSGFKELPVALTELRRLMG